MSAINLLADYLTAAATATGIATAACAVGVLLLLFCCCCAQRARLHVEKTPTAMAHGPTEIPECKVGTLAKSGSSLLHMFTIKDNISSVVQR